MPTWPLHALQLVPKNTTEIKKKGMKVDKKSCEATESTLSRN